MVIGHIDINAVSIHHSERIGSELMSHKRIVGPHRLVGILVYGHAVEFGNQFLHVSGVGTLYRRY